MAIADVAADLPDFGPFGLTADQSKISPRDRTVTLPYGIPKLTLGWGVIRWISDNLLQHNGPMAGQPFRLTEGQVKFLLHWYAVDDEGRWLYNHGVRRLAKGSGKSPFAAVLALAELLGPVRVASFDARVPGGVVGRPVVMPLVQVAATSEKQTANTMRVVAVMASKTSPLARRYGLDVGKTYIDTPGGGRLEQITSSASAAEGAEVTFAVADETEHWLPGNGGPDLIQTLVQNAAKTGSRTIETCNAWEPGKGSVAETAFDTWCDQAAGKTRADQITLYDAVVAPPDTVLTDDPEEGETSLSDALKFIYADTPWVDIEPIKQLIWSPSYSESRSRRFYLNQPNAAEEAWVTLQEWSALADPDRKLITRTGDKTPGEEIVMFFDGSKSEDHTALVGCAMSDGHIFTLGAWEPDPRTGVISQAAVQAAVESAKRRFQVLAFWADVREWETQTMAEWPELFKDDLIVPAQKGRNARLVGWDMRIFKYKFAEACEMALAEIQDKSFTHDGDWTTSRHIGNARVREQQGRFSIGKESKKSPNKIDAAICVIGARMLYRVVKAAPEYEARHKKKKGRIYSLA